MTRNVPDPDWQPRKQLGPLILVILLHAGFFYLLQNSLLQPAMPVTPKEVMAFLITPEAPKVAQPEAPKVAPPPVPKPEKKPLAKPKVTPPPKPKPLPQAISTPPEPAPVPTPSEPAAVVAPPAAPVAPSAAAVASSATPAQPRTITSGIEYLQAPQPVYPALSRRMGEEGTVMLRILVNERGRTERVEIHKSSGMARLDEAARQSVLHAVFKPYMENGRPVPVYAILPIKFQLDS